MESSRLFKQNDTTVMQEVSSPVRLIEAGLLCFRQERYVEGLVMFARAREKLSSDQICLASKLDAFMQNHALYLQAREELLQASRRFAEIDSERRAQITTIEDTLLILRQQAGDMGELPELCLAVPMSPPASTLAPSSSHSKEAASTAELYITCFGHFEVRRSGQPLTLCSSRNGQSILRYLVAQTGHCTTIDTLMALFWPDDETEVAQRKLHIAVSALRRSLSQGCIAEPGSGYILCKNRVYSLAIGIQTDVDEFLQYYQAGRLSSEERISCYERACHLYTGPFLPEDLYADWSSLQRERLTQTYVTMCRVLADHYLHVKRYEEAAQWSTAILKENRCDEAAHRQLMHIHVAQGHRSEALQQYHRCERILREELGALPLPETTGLFQTLLTNEASPPHK